MKHRRSPPEDMVGLSALTRDLLGFVELSAGYVRSGHLFLTETLSSKSAKAGDTVKLQVLGDVKVGDLVVIANKAPGVGRIETVESAGRAWHAVRLIVKLQTATLVNHKEQQLEAWNARKGADMGAAIEWTNAVLQSYGFALLALPFAPLQHGNQALLYKGTLLDAATNRFASSRPTEVNSTTLCVVP